MNNQTDEQTQGIGEDMALAALDLLARVLAPDAAGFRGFYRLAVDHAGRCTGLAPLKLACRRDQMVIDRRQKTAVAPIIEIALYRRRCATPSGR